MMAVTVGVVFPQIWRVYDEYDTSPNENQEKLGDVL